jgi:hypothetical protein
MFRAAVWASEAHCQSQIPLSARYFRWFWSLRVCSSALAQNPARPNATPRMPSTVLPPVEFDRPFHGLLMVQHLKTEAEVSKVCPTSNLKVFLACSYKLRDGCLIIMVAVGLGEKLV